MLTQSTLLTVDFENNNILINNFFTAKEPNGNKKKEKEKIQKST
jgi:hypothetical protein